MLKIKLITNTLRIQHILIKNYRNLTNLDIEPNYSGVLAIGSNGIGKTNMLEAIFYLLNGTSFKNFSSTNDFIGPDKKFLKVNLLIDNTPVEIVVSNAGKNLSKIYKINDKKTSISKIRRNFATIVFAPDSVNLISGEPALRRKDLDLFLASIYSDYNRTFGRYRKVLKNRNALLKQTQENAEKRHQLKFWTNEIIELSEILVKRRFEFFDKFEELSSKMASFIYTKDNIFNLVYETKFTEKFDTLEYIRNLKKKFAENLDKEIIVGKTLYGPHRDDYSIYFNGRNLRYIGSRGEQRIASIIIKFVQMQFFKDSTESSPILLLDDIFSELDPSHRDSLAKYIEELDEQKILTSADENEVPKNLKKLLVRVTF